MLSTHVRFKSVTENKLQTILPTNIKYLTTLFFSNNYELYVVGGCVRDVLLRRQPKDFDLVTNAMPDSVIKMLSDAKIENQTQGEHFGVVVAKFHTNIGIETYEIATLRKDLNDTEDRNTSVQLGVSIEDDVRRRDFTINALFYDLQKCKIIDLVGGIKDLKNKIIRCVGEPQQRFNEDNLRKMRCIRFTTRLDFKLHPDTLNAIITDSRLNVTPERIYNELYLMYNSAIHKYELIKILYQTTLIYRIFPDIQIQSFTEIPNITYTWNLFLAYILRQSINNQHLQIYLHQYKFPTTTIKSILFLLQDSNLNINPLYFYKSRQGTDLTDQEIIIFYQESKKIVWLVNFRPSSEITIHFQQLGFSGSELGQKLSTYYNDKYLQEIKN